MLLKLKAGAGPIRQQLRRQIRSLVADGFLAAGARLPSSRALARSLGVSRNTVVDVYDALVAEGVLVTDGTVGTFVALGPTGRVPHRQVALSEAPGPRWSAAVRRLDAGARNSPEPPARAQLTSLSDLDPWWDRDDAAEWRACLDSVLEDCHQEALGMPTAAGYAPLRQWLAGHLRLQGVRATPDHIVIVNGCQQGLYLVTRALLDPGDLVLIQDPTYPRALECLCLAGARVLGVKVDAGGLDTTALLDQLAVATPKLIHVMSAYQNPTGVTMDMATRRRLLALAEEHSFYVVDDSFSDELCYAGHLLPPLKAQDQLGMVIQLGSLSKTLFPGLRLGWIVAEPAVTAVLTRLKECCDLGTSPLLQAAFYEYCRRGHYDRHLARARRVYAQRREALAGALDRHMPPGTSWSPNQGGLTTWLNLPAGITSLRLLEGAVARGLWFEPGPRFYVDGGGESQLRLSWARLSAEEIEAGIAVLGELLRGELGAAGPGPQQAT